MTRKNESLSRPKREFESDVRSRAHACRMSATDFVLREYRGTNDALRRDIAGACVANVTRVGQAADVPLDRIHRRRSFNSPRGSRARLSPRRVYPRRHVCATRHGSMTRKENRERKSEAPGTRRLVDANADDKRCSLASSRAMTNCVT